MPESPHSGLQCGINSLMKPPKTKNLDNFENWIPKSQYFRKMSKFSPCLFGCYVRGFFYCLTNFYKFILIWKPVWFCIRAFKNQFRSVKICWLKGRVKVKIFMKNITFRVFTPGFSASPLNNFLVCEGILM